MSARQYRGVSIDRHYATGYYSAMPEYRGQFVPVMADTVDGIRRAIAAVLNHGPSAVGRR